MCHPWLAAGVSVVLLALLVRESLGAWRAPLEGVARDEAGLLGARLRLQFRARMEPLVDTLNALGASANAVTALQLAASGLCGILYARGWIFTAGWLLIGCGTLDVLDGALARKRGVASARGAFIDSVADRYSECAVFAGLAVLYRDDRMLWVVLAAFFGAFMVSYARARAEGVGVECRGGLMQRPERYVLLGGGSIVSALGVHLTCSPDRIGGVLAASLVLVAVLANLTALQRIALVLRRLA